VHKNSRNDGIHVTCYMASSYVVHFKCALGFDDAQDCRHFLTLPLQPAELSCIQRISIAEGKRDRSLVERSGSMRPSIVFRRFQLPRNGYVRFQRTRFIRILFRFLPVWFLLLELSGCRIYPSPSSGPLPAFSIAKTQDLGVIPTNPDILGRDGGGSAEFQGYSVWLYGDTFIAKANAEDQTLLSDSWSFTTDLNAQGGITGFQEQLDSAGAPTMILPLTPGEEAFNQAHNINKCQAQPCGARWALWPGTMVVNPDDDSALIFYMLVSAQPGNFNFQGIGNSVAVWQNIQQQPQRPTLNPPIVTDRPDLLFTQNEPGFGSAAFISNGTLYAYGCDYNSGCQLGKVAPSSARDRSAWSFYAGNGNWSAQIGDAISVFNDASILSISWNAYLQCYLAVYSPPFSQNVVMRTSMNPEGPWSSEIVAFAAMPPTSGNVYDALAHVEYDSNGGQTIYVSYSRSTPAPFSSEVRLVEVKFQSSNLPP
jgi:hypothetical protein